MASLKITPSEAKKLYDFFTSKGFKPIDSPHTLWAFEGSGVKIYYYRTGSLLIQGKNSQKIFREVLNLLEKRNLAGCDESGKGDIFGSLVICCVCIPEENYPKVASLNPRDTKRLSDKKVVNLYLALKPLVKAYCYEIKPKEYNELYKKFKNLNKIMTYFYKNLIEKVEKECKVSKIVVDKYQNLNPFGDKVAFETKAEKHLAVAVASIFARYKFIKSLKEIEKKLGIKIPKGATKEVKYLVKTIKNPEEFVKLNFNV